MSATVKREILEDRIAMLLTGVEPLLRTTLKHLPRASSASDMDDTVFLINSDGPELPHIQV